MTETLPEIHTGLFIAGERQDAAESFAVHDPADPEAVVGYAGAASEEQARAAVAAAHDAFPAWAALGAHERAARVKASLGALAADNDERVELLSRENGKVRSECEIEMHVIEARFELAAGLADVVDGVRELPAPPYRTQVIAPAARRREPDRPVQLAAGDPRRVAAARAGGGQHGRRQGAADDAAVVRADGRADRRRAAARACSTSSPGTTPCSGRC